MLYIRPMLCVASGAFFRCSTGCNCVFFPEPPISGLRIVLWRKLDDFRFSLVEFCIWQMAVNHRFNLGTNSPPLPCHFYYRSLSLSFLLPRLLLIYCPRPSSDAVLREDALEPGSLDPGTHRSNHIVYFPTLTLNVKFC